MMELFVATLLIGSLIVAPLGWRAWRDRCHARELMIRAEIQHTVDRALGGESFVTVRVELKSPGRRGRVVLSVPAFYEWLLDQAWRPVIERVPPGYELVVRSGRFEQRETARRRAALKSAAQRLGRGRLRGPALSRST